MVSILQFANKSTCIIVNLHHCCSFIKKKIGKWRSSMGKQIACLPMPLQSWGAHVAYCCFQPHNVILIMVQRPCTVHYEAC